jgi:putative ABC transport system permease protein
MRTLIVSLYLAWHNLMINKVRSLLTLLGMIIGVGAVIAIVSLGEGLRKQFQDEISGLGADVFYMMPKSPKRPGQAPKSPELFSMDDMDAITESAESVQQVVPGIDQNVTAKYRDKTELSHAFGVYEDYLESNTSDTLEAGRFFTMGERVGTARVALIGDEIAKDLFDEADPIGEFVKLDGVNYQIIGMLSRAQGAFTGAPNVSDGFTMPVTTVQQRIIGNDDVFWVSLYLKDGADMETAKEEVSEVMRQRRRIRNATDDDFQFMSPDTFAEMGNQFINVMIGIFGSIAFISLLVGGVGIMNIMLVSVTERTREIGLRMAVGANRQAVLMQFLVEAVMLTLLGGLIGMGMGYAGAAGIAVLLEKLLETPWQPTIPPEWVGYSVGVSVLVGVIFGTYPAFKASQLDPVEAMRYE